MTVRHVTVAPPAVRRHRRLANRCVLAVLRSPLHALLDPGLCELRYRGRRSGRRYALPVIKIPEIIQARRPEKAVAYGCYDLAKQVYGHAKTN